MRSLAFRNSEEFRGSQRGASLGRSNVQEWDTEDCRGVRARRFEVSLQVLYDETVQESGRRDFLLCEILCLEILFGDS